MNVGGDAAEQVVRLSLEGMEAAVKLSGKAAKEIAFLLAAVLKQERQSRGKTRLTQMLKSSKNLDVFAVRQKDLKKFTKHAKQYGILYCVLRDRSTKDPNALVDIIVREDDSPRIQRIVDRFEISNVNKASIVSEVEKKMTEKGIVDKDIHTKTLGEQMVEEAVGKSKQGEHNSMQNPTIAKTDKNPLSERSSGSADMRTDKGISKQKDKKPSVKEKLERYKAVARQQKEAERTQPETEKPKQPEPNRQTVHQQPKRATKAKER